MAARSDDHDDLPARIEAAAALRRLGHCLVAHRAEPSLLRRLAAAADTWTAEVAATPARSRVEEFTSKFQLARLVGGVGELIVEGVSVDLFHDSPVSGSANPMGIGLLLTRQGDTAVGALRLGSAFEGAPNRAHGGIVAACIDETMGALLPIIGTMAVTGTLSLRYLSACPLHTELEFRAWLDQREGRKLYLRATGASRSGGVFVDAEATFVALEFSDATRRETKD